MGCACPLNKHVILEPSEESFKIGARPYENTDPSSGYRPPQGRHSRW